MKEIAQGLEEARVKTLGRPPKAPDQVGRVRSLRLSDQAVAELESKAKKAGFKSWQEWAKAVLMEA